MTSGMYAEKNSPSPGICVAPPKIGSDLPKLRYADLRSSRPGRYACVALRSSLRSTPSPYLTWENLQINIYCYALRRFGSVARENSHRGPFPIALLDAQRPQRGEDWSSAAQTEPKESPVTASKTAIVETLTAEVRALPHGMHAHLILAEPQASPLTVWIPAGRVVAVILDRLTEVLRSHPGTVRVQIRAYRGDRYEVIPSDQHVDAGAGLIGDLKQLLGPACLEPRPCRAIGIEQASPR